MDFGHVAYQLDMSMEHAAFQAIPVMQVPEGMTLTTMWLWSPSGPAKTCIEGEFPFESPGASCLRGTPWSQDQAQHSCDEMWQCADLAEGVWDENGTEYEGKLRNYSEDVAYRRGTKDARAYWPGSWRRYSGVPGRSHCDVPKRHDFAAQFKTLRGESAPVTTLMIRNVPNFFKLRKLMQELDRLGFEGQYDFLYLPIDTSTTWNVGYAFVNFEDPKQAMICMEALQGHDFGLRQPNKRRPAQVSVAHIQGLADNLAHYTSTATFSSSLPSMRPWVKNWQWSGTEWHPLAGHARSYDIEEGWKATEDKCCYHDLNETVSELSLTPTKTPSSSSS